MTDSELVVDLRGRLIESLNDFWDAVSEPCGLSEWFGRTWTRGRTGSDIWGISEVIDNHDLVAGIFDGEQNRLVVHALA